jgi:hypothetical protein
MRFGDSRENRCKWFNSLGIMRKWVYIEKGDKCNISAKKKNSELIHLMYESILTTKRQAI